MDSVDRLVSLTGAIVPGSIGRGNLGIAAAGKQKKHGPEPGKNNNPKEEGYGCPGTVLEEE